MNKNIANNLNNISLLNFWYCCRFFSSYLLSSSSLSCLVVIIVVSVAPLLIIVRFKKLKRGRRRRNRIKRQLYFREMKNIFMNQDDSMMAIKKHCLAKDGKIACYFLNIFLHFKIHH